MAGSKRMKTGSEVLESLVNFRCVILSGLSLLSFAAFAQETKQDIRDYIRSLPNASYAEMSSAYDATVVPELVEMLGSPADAEYWNRVATMLGAVGDERAVEALIKVVEEPFSGTGDFLQAEHDRRRAAMMSLGFLIQRTGSERALDYLIDSLDPPVWRRRDVSGLGPGWTSYEEYDRQLSTYALFGLALSGHLRGRGFGDRAAVPNSGAGTRRHGGDADVLVRSLRVGG
jgi:hypothetical protein